MLLFFWRHVLQFSDGYEATRRLRSLGFSHPVIALTGNALAEDQHRFISAGANTLLTKPVTSAVLANTLLHCLSDHN